jgi:cell wall-associated NlpC family hydrolase
MSLSKLLCISLCVVFCLSVFTSNSFSQERARVVQENQTRSTEIQPKTSTQSTSRPTLTNKIFVQDSPSLVKKTGSSQPTAPVLNNSASKSAAGLGAVLRSRMMKSMNSKLGIPYLYGSTGPNRYDCSGLVWTIFNESGINFERGSARTFWSQFDPVEKDEQYKFGTLVFFNGLGHMGIVVDEKGFYHASSSKGVTYSKFEGYWAKRIVGFRKIPLEKYIYAMPESKEAAK